MLPSRRAARGSVQTKKTAHSRYKLRKKKTNFLVPKCTPALPVLRNVRAELSFAAFVVVVVVAVRAGRITIGYAGRSSGKKQV